MGGWRGSRVNAAAAAVVGESGWPSVSFGEPLQGADAGLAEAPLTPNELACWSAIAVTAR